ncbi:MAG: ABC transporter ATP-binding protein [Sulfurospirillum sp.]|nr:MAG: ABC transporter ATP-binding protein [Sulfurospirillum sp.]
MIELIDINKNFNEFSALKNINLIIPTSQFVILKGVSGSGKSTLLSIIASLMKPSSGEVKIDSVSTSKLPDHHASQFRLNHIGFTLQNFALIENLSAKENVSIPLIPLRLSQKEIDTRVNEVLRLANIEHKKDSIVQNLSGGERQRVAIARSIANDPKILLFDEPTASLDQENSQTVINMLKDFKKMGKTIIVATHDPIFDHIDFVDKRVYIEKAKIVKITDG